MRYDKQKISAGHFYKYTGIFHIFVVLNISCCLHEFEDFLQLPFS